MAEALAFRGIRYDPNRTEDLSLVICPPYDVISPADQARLYERSPVNAVRLEQGIELPGDTIEDNKYTRAAAVYRTWRDRGILLQEPVPVLYIYDQEFACGGRPLRRRCLLAALRLEEWEKRVVLPHEETMPRPKSDRLRLLQACRASFSPLLGLYEDCEGAIGELLARAAEAAPDAAFRDEDGEGHFLWIVQDQSLIDDVRRALATSPIYLADGHHRYETALAYRDEQRAQQPGYNGSERYNFAMIALEAVDDPGLVVLPTHRLVLGPPRLGQAELLSRLAVYFEVSRLPRPGSEYAGRVQEVLGPPRQGSPNVFGLYAGGEDALYRLELRDPAAVQAQMPAEKSPAWRELDVTILQTAIIDGILRRTGAEEAGRTELAFTRDEAYAVDSVRSGESWLALFLCPTRVAQIIEVALAGDRMPRKSTYFYPKLPAGLVMYDLR
ncbi:MAG: DUF1015 domain-containing protein [Bacteroidetes bacterium]|nr:DUF1015 domain-containing protein [Bacteroidota bacterium]MCL5025983.1 DUF1015 domain-containing protein [Chloroflexota bacterium]